MHLGGKMNRSMTWGNVISHIFNLNISVLDFGGGTAHIVKLHFGQHQSIKEAHVLLLYNDQLIFPEQVI